LWRKSSRHSTPISTTAGQRICIIDPRHFKDISDKEILREKSWSRTVCDGRMLKMLTVNCKRQRVNASQEFSKWNYAQEGEDFSNPIVAYETWVYHFTPETNGKSPDIPIHHRQQEKSRHRFLGPERCFAYWFHANGHR